MKAAPLRSGDHIGIFSASSPISATIPIRYDRGTAFLESKGYRVIHGALRGQQDHYRSGSTHRELMSSINFSTTQTSMFLWLPSGETIQTLPYIDYAYLKKHPKIIIGYSDTTALLLAIYAKTGLTTFYGPAAASSFGELPPFVDWTFQNFQQILSKDLALPYTYPLPPVWTDEYINWSQQDRSKEQYPNRWICVHPGCVQGRLIGGNLNTMEGFFGTEYMPPIQDGDILFLEDSLKDACTIERSFSLLKLAGVFDKVSGIILGKHEKFDDNGTGRAPYEILLEVLGSPQIPILADFDCCHTHPMLTLPIGCTVLLDADHTQLKLLEPPLEH